MSDLQIGVSGYIGPTKTGIGRTLENLLRALDPLLDRDKIAVYRNCDMSALDVPVGECWSVQEIGISCKKPLPNLLWHQFVYPLRLLRQRAQVSFIPNVTMLFWKVCPTVVMIHDMIEFRVPGKFSPLRMLYRYLAVPMTAHRADKIVTVSHNSKKDIVEICKVRPEKVIVAYNGVDERFRPAEETQIEEMKRRLKIRGKYLLFVGTLDHPGKNAMTLIRSFAQLHAEGLVDTLVLVGRPGHNYEALVREIETLGIQESVCLPGTVDDADLPSLYSGTEAFVFLSLYEGFGIPLVEAMACGARVVASDRSSLPEVVGNAGLLVDPLDVDSVTRAIRSLLVDDDLCNSLRTKGLQRASQFRWEEAARIVLDTLRSVSSKS